MCHKEKGLNIVITSLHQNSRVYIQPCSSDGLANREKEVIQLPDLETLGEQELEEEFTR